MEMLWRLNGCYINLGLNLLEGLIQQKLRIELYQTHILPNFYKATVCEAVHPYS